MLFRSSEEAFIQVEDFQGKPVHTRHSFLSMKMVFERLIAENPGTVFINSSEAGLKIDGAIHMPLKQALALPQVTQHIGDSRTLRQTMKAITKAYVSQQTPEFQDDFTRLCRWVGELGNIARQIIALYGQTDVYDCLVWDICAKPDRFAAVMASDVLSPMETAEEMIFERYKAIVAFESQIHERQAAFALFAIRRFDFLELMAAIPPKPDDVNTPYTQHAYNAGRLQRVATIMLEELPEVQRVLREVTRRLAPKYSTSAYFACEQFIWPLGWPLGNDDFLDSLGKYYYHTQQYAAALSVMDRNRPRKASRIRKYLDRYVAETRAAMDAYFPHDVEQGPVPNVPDDTGVYAA